MQNVVVDSSVIVKWLNRSDESNIEQADRILEDARDGKIEIFAPELAKYEVGNVLLHGKQLTTPEAFISLSAAYALPINFVGESVDMARATYALANELGITYYDAAFISLAKTYSASLITDNIKHQGKTDEVVVIPLGAYQLDS